tara:strand:- start:209 stop:3025 length:2817 start_codon:yes stop_codon:yes gene_type:complete
MASPKDIARSYPKRGMTADLGFRSEPFFCGEGSFDSTRNAGNAIQFDPDFAFTNGLSVTFWMWHDGEAATRYMGFFGLVAFGSILGNTLRFHDKTSGSSFDSTSTFNARSWHHVCFTLSQDGTTVKCYLDGAEQTLNSQPASAITLPSGTSIVDAGIATFQNNNSAGTLSMGGHLAKYALYNAVLTEDQVRRIMRAQTFAEVNAIQACQFYFELAANNTDSTGNATTVEDRGTVTYGATKPQLPRGLDLVRGAAQARCFVGRAVDFDGSTDFLDMGNGVDKNYTTRSDRASFSVWFNTDQTASAAFIYQNRTQIVTDRPECETQLLLHPGFGLVFDGEGASVRVPIEKIMVGAWHHFVGVADDSDGPVKLYLDGILYDTTSSVIAGANGSEFLIGGRNNSPLQLFNGQLSQFKIFNVELTQDQVRELYYNPETVIPTGVSASNLRRHYPLCAYNDTSGMGGRSEVDQGVEGVSGEYGGSPVMAFAQPVPCPQLGLTQSATRIYDNQSNATFYLSPAISGTPFTNQGSLEGWFIIHQKPGTGSSDYYSMFILGKYAGSGHKDLLEIVYDNQGGTPKIWCTNGNGSIATSFNHEFELGKLHHMVVTTLGSDPFWQLFINGEKKTVSTRVFSNSRTSFEFGDNLLGGGRWGNTGSFGGVCNFTAVQCAAWNTVLGQTEVTSLYNAGTPSDVSQVESSSLQAWWKCDDLSTFKDYSGNGVVGNITGTYIAQSFPENASGSTLVSDFSMKRKGVSVLNCHNVDGLEQVRTEIPSGAGVQPSLTNGHTVSVWYRNQMQNTTSANNGTFIFSGDGTTSNRYFLESLNGNTFRGAYGNIQVTGTGTISDNDWHHYAMCLDMSTSPNPTVRLYLDGVADNTGTQALGTTFPEDTTFVGYMGANRAPHNYELKGPIACVRIYNTQLSENEIKQIYHADERLIKGLNNE